MHIKTAYAKGRLAAAESDAFARGVGDQQADGDRADGQRSTPPANAGKPAGPFGARVAAEELEKLAHAEFDESPELRTEFPSFAAYLGWRRAEATGRAKVFSLDTVRRFARADFPAAPAAANR